MNYEEIDDRKLHELKVRALRDIWAFADLIDFRGEGSKGFYSLHREMAEINCRNQTMRDTKREYRRRLFLIPREHRKSTVNTVLYTLWRIYRNPDIRIIIGCNVKELANDMIREIRAYLEDSDLITWVWNDRPHIEGPLIPKLKSASNNYKGPGITEAADSKVIWTAWAIQVIRRIKDKQPTVQALSIGMKPTGKHCDLVIFDDIVDWENSKTYQSALKVQRWAHDIESVVTKKSLRMEISRDFSEWVGNEVLINGTRYYEWDFYSKYVGNSKEEEVARQKVTRYTVCKKDIYVNGVDPSDGYICPEIFDAEQERDLRDTDSITDREWFAQYRNIIIGEEESTLDEGKIHLVFNSDYGKSPYTSQGTYMDRSITLETGGHPIYNVHLHMMVDLAISVRKTADKRAIAVGGYDELFRLHVFDCRSDVWTVDEFYETIYEVADKWNLYSISYETGVGYQQSFESSMRMWADLKKKRQLVINGLPVSRQYSKAQRIQLSLEPLINSGSLYFNSLFWEVSGAKKEFAQFNPHDTHNSDNILDTIEMLSRTKVPFATSQLQSKNYGRNITINTLHGGVR